MRNFKEILWSARVDHTIANFLKSVFHKFYLVHSWIPWFKCWERNIEIKEIQDRQTYKRGYRHFSLIRESLGYQRFYLYSESKIILYEFQFGFQNNRSTTHALMEITEIIRDACDKWLLTCGVYLDFKKSCWYCQSLYFAS